MLCFYDLSDEERCRRTASALMAGRTLLERWQALEAEGQNRWARRAQRAADWFIDANITRVLDLGCGTMTLERSLPTFIRYLPSDVVRRDDRTIVCDLNCDLPPKVEADGVACLGLLEYLLDPQQVLTELAGRHRVCVLSYNTTNTLPNLTIRRSHAWFNDFSQFDLERLFERAGWSVDRAERFGPTQMLWLLRTLPH
ncbi:methyltransferase domain-containing protein [Microvirga vignae]|uniref:methyltransferase domain-containing protein n=1 Tax=Microvirga vignae TaxID=1225564 RepID=UPI000699A1B7|nr:methyltransferase domain-containing protein [Microvirga vignae]